MKRMKWLQIILVSLLSMALLIGCSANTQNAANSGKSNTEPEASDDSKQQAETQQEVTLRFSWWGGDGRHKATLDAIEAYKKVAPHVTIEAEYQGFDGYEQKIKTQLASSTAADIMQLDVPWMNELTKNLNAFLDLAAQPELVLDGFDRTFVNNFGVYNDTVVALPTGVNAYALVINKTAAEQHGIPVDISWDWDTIYEEGKKLHDKDNTKYLLSADHVTIMQDFTNMLKQRTGSQWISEDYTLGFTYDDALSGLTWIDNAMKAGVYQPLGETDLFFGKTEQNPKWINQDIIMISAMSSTLPSLKSVLPAEVEITTALPVVDKNAKDTAVLVRPAQLLAISKQTKHPEEAAKFLNWFFNDAEAAVILGDVRSIPSVTSSQQAAVDAGKIDAAITRAVDMGLKNAGMVDLPIATNSEVLAILQEVIEKVAYNKLDPSAAATELMDSLEKKLGDLKSRL